METRNRNVSQEGRFALNRNGVKIRSTTQGAEGQGVATIGIMSHTNLPSAQRVDKRINVNNLGETTMSREIAAILRFPVPVPLQVSYPKNWGTQDFGLMKEFLNQAYSLYTNDDSFSLNDAKTLGNSALQTGEDAIIRKIQNLTGASHAGGLLNHNQTELLFQGVDFRELNMSHTFAPNNEEELRENLDMINIIKKYSSPMIGEPYKLIYPKLFELELGVNRNGTIENIFKTKPCACTNIQVDYTPDQLWNVFKNGHPVKFQMDLSFKEIELLTEADFDEDNPYNSH